MNDIVKQLHEYAINAPTGFRVYHDAVNEIISLRAENDRLQKKLEPASPWRDIESAPRDGTYIDLWVNDERIPDARWNDCRRQWEVWGTGDYDRMEFIPIAGNPTHWMPLPEPPR